MNRKSIFICLAVLMLLMGPTAKINPSLHVGLGITIIPIIIIHLLLNGKWLSSSVKNRSNGKLTPKARYMLNLAIGLLIAFSVAIISGIASYQSGYSSLAHGIANRRSIDHSIMALHRLHAISALACLVLSFLHAKLHWASIKNVLKLKPRTAK